MKRDWELIRGILLQAEAAPAGTHLQVLEAENDKTTLAEVLEHIQLLVDANLLEATVVPGGGPGQGGFIIHRVTWQGHDFLNEAKNDAVWKKVMNQVKEKGGSVSMMVLKEMVSTVFKAYLSGG